eukprot:8379196-Heterocapsa_arctica.AAC.1
MHVCPPTFAPEIPLRKDYLWLRAVTANGQPLRCYGRKRVLLCTEKGVLFSVDFAVMDVSLGQTILSVGELHKKGHEVVFGLHSCLRAGEED